MTKKRYRTDDGTVFFVKERIRGGQSLIDAEEYVQAYVRAKYPGNDDESAMRREALAETMRQKIEEGMRAGQLTPLRPDGTPY